MKTASNQSDTTDRIAIEQVRRLRFDPATIVLASSLILLLGSGWLKSGAFKLAVSGVGAVLLVGWLVKIFRALTLSSLPLVDGTARQLAWIRIIVCLTALIYTLMDPLPAISHLPPGMRNDDQFFHLLNSIPAYSALVANPYLLGSLQWMTAGLLFLGLSGLLTRATLFLSAIGFFLAQAILRHYTYYYHSGLALVYLLFLLPWTPCSAVWSVDRWLNRKKTPPRAGSIRLSVYGCFGVMAAVYLVSALSKLRDSGLSWLRGENIEHHLLQDALTPIFFGDKWKPTIWLVQHHAPEFIFTVIATYGVLVELGYWTVLFSRTARIVMPIAAFCMHLGILVFQHLLFIDLLVLQLIFLDVDRIANFCRFHFRGREEGTTVQMGKQTSAILPSYIFVASIALLLTGTLLAWAWSEEFYPFSPWRMYADISKKTPVIYPRLAATLENGTSITIPIRDCSPATCANARYILFKAFYKKGWNEVFDQFLASYTERRNRNLAFGSPISSIEVQLWRWNYVVDPNDPRFGWVTDVYPYDVTSKRSSLR